MAWWHIPVIKNALEYLGIEPDRNGPPVTGERDNPSDRQALWRYRIQPAIFVYGVTTFAVMLVLTYFTDVQLTWYFNIFVIDAIVFASGWLMFSRLSRVMQDFSHREAKRLKRWSRIMLWAMTLIPVALLFKLVLWAIAVL